jgi:hypothetical protein
MNNFASIHVGHTSDDKPKVVIGIGETSAIVSPYEATRIITNLKAIIRKLKRSAWRNNDEI